MTASPERFRYVAYGLLGMPLAMATLPVYVHIPAYYAMNLDMGLAPLGWVLFTARLFDTAQDPFWGMWIDRLDTKVAPLLIAAATIFVLAFAGLWLPPTGRGSTVAWLAAMLALTYSAHSFITICYLAWGASLNGCTQALLSATAWREGAGLAGIMLASVIPAAIMANGIDAISTGMGFYNLSFALLFAVSLYALLQFAPAWRKTEHVTPPFFESAKALAKNRRFMGLLLPYFLNAVAMSLPATLALFYIRDQLKSPAWAPAFLLSYFASAVCGLPFWTKLASRTGPARCWCLGMLMAVLAFCGAALLGDGDRWSYFAVCISAGFALGADLAMPPVLFARTVRDGEGSGAYFGIYTLLSKLALACTGLSLPLLTYAGYQPGAGPSMPLVALYAGLPCVIKLLVISLMWRSDEKVSE
ncbi:MFS transporter [Pseudoduganella eburnea]|uniref:MFS transporter n=1 Tax=Massilia eburnea TaxID=1776165 RepID=A0A6L6QFK4_9BURK|nr:MFS transporter [Massilia eburnea]MTW11152.1 MFS transporter [Massilia eburnea]